MNTEVDSNKVVRLFQSSRPHKQEDYLTKAARVGMPADVYKVPDHSPERNEKCARRGGVGKLVGFAAQELKGIEDSFGPLDVAKWLVIMDVAGYVVKEGDPVQLNTGRGEMSAKDKLRETRELLGQVRGQNGGVDIRYANSVAYGLRWRDDPDLKNLGVIVGGGLLTLSPLLVDWMTTDEWWRRVERFDNRVSSPRPVINVDVNAGLDMSRFIYSVRALGNKDTTVVWTNGRGRRWMANGERLDRGMAREMSTTLRGIPMAAINHLASLRVQ